MCTRRRNAAGFSLIEQVMVILVISVGVIGLLTVMNVSILHSGDPMMRKQMMAAAESLLSEIQHQPFTWCDPDDANASTAMSGGGCAVPANRQDKSGGALTSPTPAGELRYGAGAGAQFDNVADYGGYTQTDPTDAAGNNPLVGYSTKVDVVDVSPSPSDGSVLQITVTVTNTATLETVSLTGYRYRYAPRY